MFKEVHQVKLLFFKFNISIIEKNTFLEFYFKFQKNKKF